MFRLDTGFVDLYLIHTPSGGDILRTYDAMLELKAQGLIRFVAYTSLVILSFCIALLLT